MKLMLEKYHVSLIFHRFHIAIGWWFAFGQIQWGLFTLNRDYRDGWRYALRLGPLYIAVYPTPIKLEKRVPK